MKQRIAWVLMAAAALCCLLSLKDVPVPLRENGAASGRAGVFATPAPPQGTLRVNEAEMEELIQLPGVGETLARAILDEREKNGPFRLAEDIMAVRGIGPGKFADIRPWLDLSEGE